MTLQSPQATLGQCGPRLSVALLPAVLRAWHLDSELEFTTWVCHLLAGYLGTNCALLWRVSCGVLNHRSHRVIWAPWCSPLVLCLPLCSLG